ncbi:CHRD domain-containing protein [Streptomyces flaveolus]|uniref:CHRD domain-containing protein n=1 Tax=Streptomyces flaveolus TaxID=67297 RepID=UPI003408A717
MSFTADLTGDQEVPAEGKKVDDPDGHAQVLARIKGDRITFAFKWQGIGAPTLGHIHQGKAGVNGDVKVPLFTTPMPDTVDAGAGQVTVDDAALVQQLRTDPSSFYVNLHSKEFPDGAVRGQLTPVRGQVNPLGIIDGGAEHSLMSGDQEVPAEGKKVDDPDGHAITFLYPDGNTVGYSMAWLNIAPPTLGHIHQGVLGQNGDVKVPLFTTPIPSGIFAISGKATNQDPAVVKQPQANRSDFYSNLHTSEFLDGTVRGQLFGQSQGDDGSGQENGGQGGTNNGSSGSAAGNHGQGTPSEGSAVLFEEANDFSENNPSQSVSGKGCVDVFRPGAASAIQTEKPIKAWSGKGCTGDSQVIAGDTADLGTVNFDNKISSVFFGSLRAAVSGRPSARTRRRPEWRQRPCRTAQDVTTSSGSCPPVRRAGQARLDPRRTRWPEKSAARLEPLGGTAEPMSTLATGVAHLVGAAGSASPAGLMRRDGSAVGL